MRIIEIIAYSQIDNVSTSLDLYSEEEIGISLNYQIADIVDVSKQKTDFSDSILIPETAKNKDFFAVQSNLNINQNFKFDVNMKTKCIVYAREIPIMYGYLQLVGIHLNLNGSNDYEILITGNNKSLFTTIGDKYITDLTSLHYLDHINTTSNIVHSWTQSIDWGYYYPLIDYGNNLTASSISNLANNTLTPAFYVKSIFDGIFFEADSEYESNFLNSDYFKNLVIPTYTSNIKQGSLFQEINGFRAGTLTGYDYTPTWIDLGVKYDQQNFGTYGIFPGWEKYWPNIGTDNTFATFSIIGNPTVSKIELEDTITPPDYDLYNSWKTSGSQSFIYTYTGTGSTNLRFNIQLQIPVDDIIIKNNYDFAIQPDLHHDDGGIPPTITFLSPSASNTRFWLQIRRSRDPNTGIEDPNFDNGRYGSGYPFLGPPNHNVYPFSNDFPLTGPMNRNKPISAISTEYGYTQSLFWAGENRYTYNINIQTYWSDNSNIYSKPLWPGEKVRFSIYFQIANNPYGLNNLFPPFGHNELLINGGGGGFTYSYYWVTPNSFIEVEFGDNQYQSNQFISAASSLSPKIKQKDFLQSIFNMFNLQIEYDNIKNKYLIEPSNDYYHNGNLLDWTNKLDSSEEIDIKTLSNTQPKDIIYKYKDGKDLYNNDYQLVTNKSYGEYHKFNNNDFSNETKSTEIIFTSIPLVQKENSSIIYPVIRQMNSYDGIINIMFKNIQQSPLLSDKFGFDGVQYFSDGLAIYPYIGHLDNPYSSNYDLNWTQANGYYFDVLDLMTNNNLINMFWKSTISDLVDPQQRLITLKMRLLPLDLMTLKFNNRINMFLKYNNIVFKINKISGYDPVNNNICEVEVYKYTNPLEFNNYSYIKNDYSIIPIHI